MSDTHLFFLDADQKWDLAYDRNQWMIRRNKGVRKAQNGAREAGHSAIKWEPRRFIGSEKTGLLTFILGNDIELTEEAKAKLNALPDRFLDWHERHTAEVKLTA